MSELLSRPRGHSNGSEPFVQYSTVQLWPGGSYDAGTADLHQQMSHGQGTPVSVGVLNAVDPDSMPALFGGGSFDDAEDPMIMGFPASFNSSADESPDGSLAVVTPMAASGSFAGDGDSHSAHRSVGGDVPLSSSSQSTGSRRASMPSETTPMGSYRVDARQRSRGATVASAHKVAPSPLNLSNVGTRGGVSLNATMMPASVGVSPLTGLYATRVVSADEMPAAFPTGFAASGMPTGLESSVLLASNRDFASFAAQAVAALGTNASLSTTMMGNTMNRGAAPLSSSEDESSGRDNKRAKVDDDDDGNVVGPNGKTLKRKMDQRVVDRRRRQRMNDVIDDIYREVLAYESDKKGGDDGVDEKGLPNTRAATMFDDAADIELDPDNKPSKAEALHAALALVRSLRSEVRSLKTERQKVLANMAGSHDSSRRFISGVAAMFDAGDVNTLHKNHFLKATVAFGMTDVKTGKCISCNGPMAEMMGFSPVNIPDMLGRTTQELILISHWATGVAPTSPEMLNKFAQMKQAEQLVVSGQKTHVLRADPKIYPGRGPVTVVYVVYGVKDTKGQIEAVAHVAFVQ